MRNSKVSIKQIVTWNGFKIKEECFIAFLKEEGEEVLRVDETGQIHQSSGVIEEWSIYDIDGYFYGTWNSIEHFSGEFEKGEL